jgi:hypothetical protein
MLAAMPIGAAGARRSEYDGRNCSKQHAFMIRNGINGLTSGREDLMRITRNKVIVDGVLEYHYKVKTLTSTVVLCSGKYNFQINGGPEGPAHPFRVGRYRARLVLANPPGSPNVYVYARRARSMRNPRPTLHGHKCVRLQVLTGAYGLIDNQDKLRIEVPVHVGQPRASEQTYKEKDEVRVLSRKVHLCYLRVAMFDPDGSRTPARVKHVHLPEHGGWTRPYELRGSWELSAYGYLASPPRRAHGAAGATVQRRARLLEAARVHDRQRRPRSDLR